MWPVRSSFITAVILLKERSRLKALPVTVGTLVNPLWEQLQKSCWLQWSQDGFLLSVFNLWPQLSERKRRTRMKERAEEQLVGRLMLHEISEEHEVVYEMIYKSGRKWVILLRLQRTHTQKWKNNREEAQFQRGSLKSFIHNTILQKWKVLSENRDVFSFSHTLHLMVPSVKA